MNRFVILRESMWMTLCSEVRNEALGHVLNMKVSITSKSSKSSMLWLC